MDGFIDQLAARENPRCRVRSLACLFFTWIGGITVYIAAVLFLYLTPRPDLLGKLLGDRPFEIEILSLIAIIAATAMAAAVAAYPDAQQKRFVFFLPPVAFALFVWTMFLAWLTSMPPPLPEWHEMNCTVCITLLSLPPAILLTWQIRHMATVRPRLAATNAFLAAFAAGALALRLSEPTNSISHLVHFHYLPMLGIVALGVVIGRKLFRW
jgi:hypothetical protein